MKYRLAHYRCWRCEAEWHHKQGGKEHPPPNACPNCGHLYFTWLNYDAWTG